jgi:hypothetical protein
MEALRARVGEARRLAESLRRNEQLSVEAVRRTWRKKPYTDGEAFPRKAMPTDELRALLSRRPSGLSTDQITAIGDSLSVRQPSNSEVKLAARTILAKGAFPLAPVIAAHEPISELATDACKRFSMWGGQVVSTILGHPQICRYDAAVAFAIKLLRRLSSEPYKEIQGVGGGDPEMRLLIAGPCITGLCEHYPAFFPPGGPGSRAGVAAKIARLLTLAKSKYPFSECLAIRLAALVVIGGVRSGAWLVAEANKVARDRMEFELADVYQLFADDPWLLDAIVTVPRRRFTRTGVAVA